MGVMGPEGEAAEGRRGNSEPKMLGFLWRFIGRDLDLRGREDVADGAEVDMTSSISEGEVPGEIFVPLLFFFEDLLASVQTVRLGFDFDNLTVEDDFAVAVGDEGADDGGVLPPALGLLILGFFAC